MRIVILLVAVLFSVLVLAACGEEEEPSIINTSEVNVLEQIDLSRATVNGSRAFIPINSKDIPALEEGDFVLNLINDFEVYYSVDVVHYHVDRTDAYKISDMIHGIWIDHKPK